METHLVPAITVGCQSLILIGDPQQLRPKVNQYKFETVSGEGYNFDISMVERSCTKHRNNNEKFKIDLPVIELHQHFRMRPEISHLIRISLYPNLVAERVKQYPNVAGFSSNLFFYDHDFKENGQGENE